MASRLEDVEPLESKKFMKFAGINSSLDFLDSLCSARCAETFYGENFLAVL